MDPNRFLGDPDAYREWVAANPQKFNPTFCSEHWMPCPVEGRNGMLASIILMTESFALLPPNVTTPDAMNSWWANQTTSVCCRLGDEKMAWLWWLIADERQPILCRERSPETGKSIRVCWRLKDHDGEHEWERPFPRSIFDLMAEVHP